MEHLRFFLECDCRTLRAICSFRGWRDGKRCYLATGEVQKIAINKISKKGGIPEAEEVSYFLLGCLMTDILDLLGHG